MDELDDEFATKKRATAVVRLLRLEGGRQIFTGLGLFIGASRVVTCAHVVNAALSRAHNEQQFPAQSLVLVQFIFLEDKPIRFGTVVAWQAPPQSGVGHGDVAGILLKEDAPLSAHPGSFVRSAPSPNASLEVFGYPEDPPRELGAWVSLDYKGVLEDQFMQVESVAGQTIRAQPGYSGSPVWDVATGHAIGLLHGAAGYGATDRDALVVPGKLVAEAWPSELDILPPPDSPYRGLAAFTEVDADLFFGRDDDITRLTDKLLLHRAVVVTGPSGVGKSSLVQAGLLPALRRTNGNWEVALVRPELEPWYRLADRLLDVEGQHGDHSLADLDAAVERLRRDGIRAWSPLIRTRDRRLLVVVDQFEQLLNTDGPVDTDFLNQLLDVAEDPDSSILIIISLRTDYLDKLLKIPGLAQRLQDHLFVLGPLSPSQLSAAITAPAATCGVQFEDGLVQQIIDDALDGSLPLLQFTLSLLWKRQRNRVLALLGYREVGGVLGSLDSFAERQIQTLGPKILPSVDGILQRLVRIPSEAPELTTRRRLYHKELELVGWQVVERLVSARLVSIYEDLHGQRYAELAHEALITKWNRLNRIVHDNAEFLAWLSWVDQRMRDGEELSEARVAEALRWKELRPDSIPTATVTFIDQSQGKLEKRRAEQVRLRVAEESKAQALEVADSLRLATEALDALNEEPQTALLVAWEAILRNRNELSERAFRECLDLMSAATTDVVHVVALSSHGFLSSGGFASADTVFAADGRGCLTLCPIDGDSDTVAVEVPGRGDLDVEAYRNGAAMLAYRGGVLRLYDVRGEALCQVALHDQDDQKIYRSSWQSLSCADNGLCMVHHADRGWLVSVSVEPNPDLVIQHRFHFPDSANRACIDPTGAFIVTMSLFDQTRVWAPDGEMIVELARPAADARILPPGVVVVGSSRGELSMWGLDAHPVANLREGGNGDMDMCILAIDFASKRFATAVRHGSAVIGLWSFDGEELGSFDFGGIQNMKFRTAAFSCSGHLALSGGGGVIRVFDRQLNTAPIELHGHQGDVQFVQFHPHDPNILLSGDFRGEIRLWRLSTHESEVLTSDRDKPAIRFLTTAHGWTVAANVSTVEAISATGDRHDLGGLLDASTELPSRDNPFVIVTDRAQVSNNRPGGQIWDIRDASKPSLHAQFPPDLFDNSPSVDLFLSDNGDYLLILSGGLARLWSTTSATIDLLDQPLSGLHGDYNNQIVGGGFHPDGDMVVVSTRNGDNRIWNIDGTPLKHFGDLDPHPAKSDDLYLCVAIDPQGEMIATGMRDQVRLWDWSGQPIRRLLVSSYKTNRVVFSPDGERILTQSNGPNLDLWELWSRKGDLVAKLAPQFAPSWAATNFDPSGRYITFFDGGAVSIFDDAGSYLGRIASSAKARCYDYAISPDGNLIAALFDTGVTRIWSFPLQRRMQSLKTVGALLITFSPDGKTLYAGNADGALTAHPLSLDDLLVSAASRLTRVLDPTELERFGISNPRLHLETLRTLRRQ